MESSTRQLGEAERSRRCYQLSRLRTQVGQERFRLKLLLGNVRMLTSVVSMSDVIPSLNGWRQRVEVLLHNMVRAEGQEQELADELSESLEWHTGTMKIPSRSAWAMALDKHRLLAEMTLASY